MFIGQDSPRKYSNWYGWLPKGKGVFWDGKRYTERERERRGDRIDPGDSTCLEETGNIPQQATVPKWITDPLTGMTQLRLLRSLCTATQGDILIEEDMKGTTDQSNCIVGLFTFVSRPKGTSSKAAVIKLFAFQ